MFYARRYIRSPLYRSKIKPTRSLDRGTSKLKQYCDRLEISEGTVTAAEIGTKVEVKACVHRKAPRA